MAHDDVLPYSNTSMDPFVHELFGQFLVPSNADEDGRCVSVCEYYY